jgi:aryl-alcohol dehydrogenase-like predicted oxidoreductase
MPLINRPTCARTSRVRGKPLPLGGRTDCDLGQFFMKFIVAHPAVTCVIPATTSAANMRDNLAGVGVDARRDSGG